jgi:hypothetical protein
VTSALHVDSAARSVKLQLMLRRIWARMQQGVGPRQLECHMLCETCTWTASVVASLGRRSSDEEVVSEYATDGIAEVRGKE